jgi:hypothetical protein
MVKRATRRRDLADLAVDHQREVVAAQILNRMSLLIDDLHVDRHDVDR